MANAGSDTVAPDARAAEDVLRTIPAVAGAAWRRGEAMPQSALRSTLPAGKRMEPAPENPTPLRPLSAEIQWSVNYIRRHYIGKGTVRRMAQLLNISTFHFLRKFHAETGLTPGQYLIRWRMRKAVEWLRESDLPVRDIAEKTGYHNAASFSRAFRQVCGASPRTVRSAERARRKGGVHGADAPWLPPSN